MSAKYVVPVIGGQALVAIDNITRDYRMLTINEVDISNIDTIDTINTVNNNNILTIMIRPKIIDYTSIACVVWVPDGVIDRASDEVKKMVRLAVKQACH